VSFPETDVVSSDSISIEARPGGLFAVSFCAMEHKYSRYRDDSVVAWIHRRRGQVSELDPETASLMDFAQQCFEMSGGVFDITSGILRRAWKFDGSDRVPDPAGYDSDWRGNDTAAGSDRRVINAA
jgi:thiamine biosynthesis lipoprotein ApbE